MPRDDTLPLNSVSAINIAKFAKPQFIDPSMAYNPQPHQQNHANGNISDGLQQTHISNVPRRKKKNLHAFDTSVTSGPMGGFDHNSQFHSQGVTSVAPGNASQNQSPYFPGQAQFEQNPMLPPSGQHQQFSQRPDQVASNSQGGMAVQHGYPNSSAQYNAYPSQQSRPGPQGGKMSPDAIPDYVADTESHQRHWRKTTYLTNQPGQLPPPANVDFTAIDGGVSNPKFARLSLGVIPTTDEILQASGLPLSLVVQPFAALKSEELIPLPSRRPSNLTADGLSTDDVSHGIPLVDFGEGGPPRCSRCRTYINPHVTFTNGGAKFSCNICTFSNDVPEGYYSPADPYGRRQDWESRPELRLGTCEFTVPREYYPKGREPGSGLGVGGAGAGRVVFAIDVSEQSVSRGLPKAAADSIRRVLYGQASNEADTDEVNIEAGDERIADGVNISIITFDRSCHFYNLDKDVTAATQIMYVSDVDEMFIPLHQGLFVDPKESRDAILMALGSISSIFERERVPEPVLGAVVQGLYLALRDAGGKASLFLSALPTWGPGKLKMREDQSLYHTDQEKTLFDAANVYWKNIAEKFVEAGIGVDTFLFPNAYIDVATVGTISSLTGGDSYYYQNFLADRDGEKLCKEVQHSITREQGFQAQMKVRCSNGLKVVKLLGNFTHRTPSELEMSSIDADKAITIVFKHEDKLDPKSDIHFQSAVLYTTMTGERRLRTHNVRASVSGNIGDVVRSCDAGTCMATLAKEGSTRVYENPMKEVKIALAQRCVKVLASYRKNCAPQVPPSELILPESLKLFPLLILCVQKQYTFRGKSAIAPAWD